MNKIFSIYISFVFFLTAGVFAFADQPSSSTDDKSSPEITTNAQVQAPTAAAGVTAADGQTSYLNDINKLVEKSRENIKDVNEKIKEQAILKRNQKREERAREYYKKGVELTNEGKLNEARDYFEKAIRITQNPEMAPYVKELADERQRSQELKDKIDDAGKIYAQAVRSYRDHKWEESKAQFGSVEQIIPDFKNTRRYLEKIGTVIAKANIQKAIVPSAPVPVAVVVPATAPVPAAVVTASAPAPKAIPAPVNVAATLEDQQKQAQDIAALSEKSAELYRQIADIADDESTKQTKVKMAQVDEILNNLKDNKEHLVHQMQEEEFKRQQEQSKAKQEERRAEAEKMYEDGLEYLRSHDFAKAKIKFMELEDIIPDYKATRRYLSRTEEGLKKANVEAVTSHEQKEAAHLKQLQGEESADEMRRAQEEQEKQHNIELQQQASLKELTGKASDINDQIISLSQQQDYEAMKAKFTELENTLTALTKLKDQMSNQKYSQEHAKELAREALLRHDEVIRVQKQEDRQIHVYDTQHPPKENRPVLSDQPSDAEFFKRREIMQEQNMLFSEGVDRYEHKKFSQAKLLFGELADQHDRRAEPWLKKVDRAITQQLLRSQEAEERERTAFIADQVKAQHELLIIQEREHQRQKQLTEELERQKRLFEDDRLSQLRKEETMKAQERERQRQEAKRLQLEREGEKRQEMLRFHKIETVASSPEAKPQIVQAQPAVVVQLIAPKPVVASPVTPSPAVVVPPVMTARQLQAQAREEARQKRIEERQKEKERQKELRAQREEERQANLKAKAEKSAQEQKRREELMRQQAQEREEKIKQEQIIREEAQRRQELERQEHQRQSQLEAQRESVRKQLEDGVEVMYEEALRLYKQGEYTAAADRFKDVEDILPGYKSTEQYLDEARQKSLDVNPQAVIVPETSGNASASPPQASRQDNISKALDLFEPNVK